MLVFVLGCLACFFLGFGIGVRSPQIFSTNSWRLPFQQKSSTPTTFREVETLQGKGISIKVINVERSTIALGEPTITITVDVVADSPCPYKNGRDDSSGPQCGVSSQTFKLVDEDGYVLQKYFPYRSMSSAPLSDAILKEGERKRGEIYFTLSEEKQVYFLSYHSGDGKEGADRIRITLPSPTSSARPAPTPYTASGCKRGGCSGQLCLSQDSQDSVTTCEYRSEYACYQQARCEVQANGMCGFTQTPELQSCLAPPKEGTIGLPSSNLF